MNSIKKILLSVLVSALVLSSNFLPINANEAENEFVNYVSNQGKSLEDMDNVIVEYVSEEELNSVDISRNTNKVKYVKHNGTIVAKISWDKVGRAIVQILNKTMQMIQRVLENVIIRLIENLLLMVVTVNAQGYGLFEYNSEGCARPYNTNNNWSCPRIIN